MTIKERLSAMSLAEWRRPNTAIAEEHGCSHTFVGMVRQELGVRPYRKKAKKTDPPPVKKTGIQFLKEKFGISAGTNPRDAINSIIRGHVVGGAEVLDASRRLKQIQHGSPDISPLISEASSMLTLARKKMVALVLSWNPKTGGRPVKEDEVDWSKVDWNKTDTELADALNVSRQTVWRTRKKIKAESASKK